MVDKNEIVTFKGAAKSAQESLHLDDNKISAFLTIVGDRVRNGRAHHGISRRKLSQLSGVSERYLAQLETGCGNISIVLLLKLATTLQVPIEWLLMDHDPWNDEQLKMANLFQAATKSQRSKIMGILDIDQPDRLRARRIALVGMRGAGKSTLGKMVAQKTGKTFLELGGDISDTAGMPVAEIFSLYGQEGYRALEIQSLERIAATNDELILEVSGGIASTPDNFNYLLANYHTIWISTEAQEHIERVRKQGDARPMAGSKNALNQLKLILAAREAAYWRCDFHVDTSRQTKNESFSRLLAIIETLVS